jgi:hypothetical protein
VLLVLMVGSNISLDKTEGASAIVLVPEGVST